MRVCRRFEVIDVHRTSRLGNFTSANQVFPGIARNWHQARDGMAAVSDLDRFPGGHFFEVPAGVLPQLPHPYRLHVLHSSTCAIHHQPSRRPAGTAAAAFVAGRAIFSNLGLKEIVQFVVEDSEAELSAPDLTRCLLGTNQGNLPNLIVVLWDSSHPAQAAKWWPLPLDRERAS